MKNSVIIIVEKTMQNYFSDENKLIEMLDKHDKISELMNYQEVLLDKKLFLNLQKQKIPNCVQLGTLWRRERDLNPRSSCPD